MNKIKTDRLIGEGSFCKVYLGFYKNEKVAIKIYKKRTSPLMAKNEILILKKIENVDNCCHLIYFCFIKTHVLVTKLYTGKEYGNVLDFIETPEEKRKGKGIEVIKRVARDVLLGLRELKLLRIVHSDIKPENILFDGEKAVIIDFGNAIDLSTIKNPDWLIQTAQYRCPESILGLSFDFSADVWSLGCVLYEMWTQKYLFNYHDLCDCCGCFGFKSSTEQHLLGIEELCGEFNRAKLHKSNLNTEFLFKNKNRKTMFGVLGGHNKIDVLFAKFLEKMLRTEAHHRFSAEWLLGDEFLIDV